MSNRKSLLKGSVSAFALLATAGLAQAQDATPAAPVVAPAQVAQAAPAQPAQLEAEQIVVTGIRASLHKSMEVKRNADGVVEAVSAEDIGRLPDKNIGDAVQRLPGITTIQSASAGSGGFGENDRIEIRGTAPTLTQTLVNGHSISTGDWFILDQLQAASRSVSTEVIPSTIVDRIVVHKSSEADLPEGGTSGSVDIITRTPLSFQQDYTAQLTAGGVINDLRGVPGPDLNGLVNWKNSDGTIGIMLQGFYTDRFLRRDGQEVLGYGGTIPNSAPFPTSIQGAQFPQIINSALFEQERERRGGDFAVEWKPTSQFDVKLDGFYSYENDPNFNQGDLTGLNHFVTSLAGPPVGGTPTNTSVQNGVLTSATFPGSAAYGQPGVNDIYRPDALASSYYVNLEGTYTPTSNLSFHGQVGYTQGKGGTNQFALGTSGNATSDFSYQMNGSGPISISYPNSPQLNNPANYTAFGGNGNQDWVGFLQLAFLDTEGYGSFDAEYQFDDGIIQSVKAGVRVTEHERNSTETENFAGCYSAACNLSLGPISNGSFPSNFGSGGGFSAPFNVSVDPELMKAEVLAAINSNGGPGATAARFYYPAAYNFKEDTDAGYVMAKLGGSNWQGNVGIRVAATDEEMLTYDTNPINPTIQPVTTSLFGNFYKNPHSNTYVDILPSAAFKFDLTPDWVVRTSASQTVTRPDYYALAGGLALTDQLLVGQGSNPALKPTRSSNFDLATEWYYAPDASLAVGLFDMQMQSTFDVATTQQTLVNLTLTQNVNNPCGLACPIYSTYNISAPVNNSGQSRGVEISWQQPFSIMSVAGFGVATNFTYAQSSQNNPTAGIGGRQLLGASKDTGNFTVYYQNDLGDVHLSYTRHSQIYEGLDGRGDKYFVDDGGQLNAQANFNITKNFQASVSVLNLADEVENDVNQHDEPLATYDNGRTIYFSVTAKY